MINILTNDTDILQIRRRNGQTCERTYSLSLGEGEPEDMYLFRDLNDVYFITDLIQKAYEAGKRGEGFEYDLIEEKDE